jgi:hypothetical protein
MTATRENLFLRTLDDDGRFTGDTVEVSNPTRSRRWGFGYSTHPTGESPYGIERPSRPYHVGTIKQVREAIAADRTLRSLRSGGTFMCRSWFFDGVAVSSEDVQEWLDDLDAAEMLR